MVTPPRCSGLIQVSASAGGFGLFQINNRDAAGRGFSVRRSRSPLDFSGVLGGGQV